VLWWSVQLPSSTAAAGGGEHVPRTGTVLQADSTYLTGASDLPGQQTATGEGGRSAASGDRVGSGFQAQQDKDRSNLESMQQTKMGVAASSTAAVRAVDGVGPEEARPGQGQGVHPADEAQQVGQMGDNVQFFLDNTPTPGGAEGPEQAVFSAVVSMPGKTSSAADGRHPFAVETSGSSGAWPRLLGSSFKGAVHAVSNALNTR